LMVLGNNHRQILRNGPLRVNCKSVGGTI
jgi:hypothetical protein